MSDQNQNSITGSQLVADLRQLGVKVGDTIMLHSSVKALGWIVGGPRTVLRALFDVLTAEGTVMMLASWEGNPYEMSDWPEEQQKLWRDECPAFDPQTSPADHRELSILAEYLRTWPGAERSTHPLASFVAAGKRAEWLTETHPAYYGMGTDSPLGRLCEAGGRVLLLGAPLSNVTLLHHAEQLVDLPEKHIDRYQMPVLQSGRKVWIDVEEFDTTEGIADFGVEDYFHAIGETYLADGRGQSGRVGQAQSYLLEADDFKTYAMEWMAQNYRPT
jgi:aminoglycoside 3-N-acetyltransferase